MRPASLIHPSDLAAWHRWQQRRHPLRSAARAVRGRLRPAGSGGAAGRVTQAGPGSLVFGDPDPEVLVVLETYAPTSMAALATPLAHLPGRRVALLGPAAPARGVPAPLQALGPGRPWDGRVPPAGVLLSAGNYLPLGALAHDAIIGSGGAHLVVQHGVLTPAAPPLPAGSTLLSWSDQDADFWRSGRDDLRTSTVGSQLLWEAGQPDTVGGEGCELVSEVPTYLGQLHGAELPRRSLAAAAERFCLATGASYRPHPGETDRASLRQHRAWAARGIRIETDGRPLSETGTPIVSVFSTGVLEAAARGLPSWVDHPDPPAWLRDFWHRYRMHPYGSGGQEPTPAPERSPVSPAELVAGAVEELLG